MYNLQQAAAGAIEDEGGRRNETDCRLLYIASVS